MRGRFPLLAELRRSTTAHQIQQVERRAARDRARMDVEREVWAILKESLEATEDPDIGIKAARKAIDEFIRDCREWAAEADGR